MTHIEHPVAGRMRVLDVPLFMSDTARETMSPAPILGADTEAVLRRAGFEPEEIRGLLDARVIGQG